MGVKTTRAQVLVYFVQCDECDSFVCGKVNESLVELCERAKEDHWEFICVPKTKATECRFTHTLCSFCKPSGGRRSDLEYMHPHYEDPEFAKLPVAGSKKG